MAKRSPLTESEFEAFVSNLQPPVEHSAKVDEAHERIAEQTAAFDSKPPTLLYHYTSVAAAASILESRSMRATNLFFMNDATELSYASRLCQSRLMHKATEWGREPLAVTLCQSLAAMIGSMSAVSNPFSVEVYASCYSTAPDDVGQWRAYADGGKGVALAFRAGHLQQATGGLLVEVVYDADTQQSMLDTAIDNECRSLLADAASSQPAEEGLPKDFWPLLRAQMTGIIPLLDLASRFKHPSFAHEKEWRLREFHRDSSQEPSNATQAFYIEGYEKPRVQFRVHESHLTPYINHTGTGKGPLPLHAVVVGPKADQGRQAAAIRLVVQATGHRDAGIAAAEAILQ